MGQVMNPQLERLRLLRGCGAVEYPATHRRALAWADFCPDCYAILVEAREGAMSHYDPHAEGCLAGKQENREAQRVGPVRVDEMPAHRVFRLMYADGTPTSAEYVRDEKGDVRKLDSLGNPRYGVIALPPETWVLPLEPV